MRLTTTPNSSNIRTTTTKPRPRARYIDWSALFQPANFRNFNISRPMGIPKNINAYTQWVKRQKRVCIKLISLQRNELFVFLSLAIRSYF
jgi:hypothetical protein